MEENYDNEGNIGDEEDFDANVGDDRGAEDNNSGDLIDNDVLELGSMIKISGFRVIDGGKLIVAKKMIGNYVKKIEERHEDFREIYIHLKIVHGNKHEIQVKTLIGGDARHFNAVDYNLFVALDSALNRALQNS